MFGKRFASAIIAAAVMSAVAFAQEENVAYKYDAAVQAFGSFVKTTNQNGIQQSATNSGGVLASYRFFFNDHNGVELNYGYSQNTQNYTGLGVDSRSHEASAAYVLRFPKKRWTPFVLAGAGGLVFDRRISRRRAPRLARWEFMERARISISHNMYLCEPNTAD